MWTKKGLVMSVVCWELLRIDWKGIVFKKMLRREVFCFVSHWLAGWLYYLRAWFIR